MIQVEMGWVEESCFAFGINIYTPSGKKNFKGGIFKKSEKNLDDKR